MARAKSKAILRCETQHRGCHNQVFRPAADLRIPGWGNCLTCRRHPDNRFCLGYQQSTVTIYRIVLRKDGEA